MTSITVNAATAAQLAAVTGEVQLRDETGRVIGSFHPQKTPTIEEVIAACPTPPEEAERQIRQAIEDYRAGKQVGRPLKEIIADLDRQYGDEPQ